MKNDIPTSNLFFDKYFLLIKKYWEYLIIIIPLILLYCLDSTSEKKSNVFFFSFVGFISMICLIITNLKHESETNSELFNRYSKIGAIAPVTTAVLFLFNDVLLGSRDARAMTWAVVGCLMMGIITIPLSIVIGFSTRFIIKLVKVVTH